MKFGSFRAAVAAAAAVPALALGIGLAAGGAASAATLLPDLSAVIGKIPVEVSAAGAGASAVVNAADTISLTVGSGSGSYAQAALDLPAGSVPPGTPPTVDTSHLTTGGPRFGCKAAQRRHAGDHPGQRHRQ